MLSGDGVGSGAGQTLERPSGLAVVPHVELGRRERLWESPDELLDRFHLEVVPSPSGVTHHVFWRR